MDESHTNFPSQITGKTPEGKPVIPQARIQAVIDREETKARETSQIAEKLVNEIPEVADVTQSANDRMDEAQREVNDVQTRVDEANQLRQNEEVKFFGLGKLFGKKDRETQEESDRRALDDARRKLEEAARASDTANKTLNEMTTARDQAESQSIHAQEVAEANRRGGPTEVSAKMTDALKQQDVVRYYTEAGYEVDSAERLMPLAMIRELSEEIRALPHEFEFVERFHRQTKYVSEVTARIADGTASQGDIENFPRSQQQLKETKATMEKRIKEIILDMTPFFEAAVELADKEQIPISQKLMLIAMREGMMITRGVQGEYSSEAYDFARNKKGRNVTWSEIGYYAIGASQLEKFFRRRKNITGRNRLPYIMAYAAGVNSNRSVMHTAQHFRDWLAESIPVPVTEMVRQGNDWVDVESGVAEKGFGHSLEYSDEMLYRLHKETRDQGWYKAVREANRMADDVFAKLRGKRRFGAEQHYTSGMNRWGPPVFDDPRLLSN